MTEGKSIAEIIVAIALVACANMAGHSGIFFNRYRGTKKGQALGVVELMG